MIDFLFFQKTIFMSFIFKKLITSDPSSMLATILYPCVTEKQIYLNVDLYIQGNRVQNLKKYGVENKADNKKTFKKSSKEFLFEGGSVESFSESEDEKK